jgi:hypothetical protein
LGQHEHVELRSSYITLKSSRSASFSFSFLIGFHTKAFVCVRHDEKKNFTRRRLAVDQKLFNEKLLNGIFSLLARDAILQLKVLKIKRVSTVTREFFAFVMIQ